jgi:uncharacterized membrane protein
MIAKNSSNIGGKDLIDTYHVVQEQSWSFLIIASKHQYFYTWPLLSQSNVLIPKDKYGLIRCFIICVAILTSLRSPLAAPNILFRFCNNLNILIVKSFQKFTISTQT